MKVNNMVFDIYEQNVSVEWCQQLADSFYQTNSFL